jgi:predicted GIY-YIG superfamily endonuclease
MLTSAKSSSNCDAQSQSVKKCGGKRCGCCTQRCGCCTHIEESTSVTFESGTVFNVKSNMDCNSSNVIYVITCMGCNGQYIGETGDVLRNRIRVHRQHVNDANTRQLRVSEHIALCSKMEPKFKVFPFYKLGHNDTAMRREKEQFFIRKFRPTLN